MTEMRPNIVPGLTRGGSRTSRNIPPTAIPRNGQLSFGCSTQVVGLPSIIAKIIAYLSRRIHDMPLRMNAEQGFHHRGHRDHGEQVEKTCASTNKEPSSQPVKGGSAFLCGLCALRGESFLFGSVVYLRAYGLTFLVGLYRPSAGAGQAQPLENMLGCGPAALRYTYSNIGRGEP